MPPEFTHDGKPVRIRFGEEIEPLNLVKHSLVAHRVGEQLLGLCEHSVKGDARFRHVATDVPIVILI